MLSIKKSLGCWELSFSDSTGKEDGVEVLWVAPRNTTFAWIKDFLNIAGRLPKINSIRVSNCVDKSAQEREQLGLTWHPYHVSQWGLWIIWLKGLCFHYREINRVIATHRGTEIGELHFGLRSYWKTCLLDSAEDMIWEAVFSKTISRKTPVLMFFTHFYNRGVAAFLRVAESLSNVKSVYIQHGLNNLVYYPPRCDKYWTLTTEDRDTLTVLGVKPEQIAILKKIGAQAYDPAVSSPTKINDNKIVFFINQYSFHELFTSEYILHYLEKVAVLAEEHGWRLIIRPHPEERRMPGFEKLQATHPMVQIDDDGKTLIEHLQIVRPALAASFFSTGVLEALALNAMPILLQVGLEALTKYANFDFSAFTHVIKEDQALERELTQLMTDLHYRQARYQSLRENYERSMAETVNLETLYREQLAPMIV
ncbi:MAG: polysialyltransferase family glycosyltransferase [Thermoguttaceae bacterium]